MIGMDAENKNALIGILMLNTTFKRILGDIGNPTTFNFPVLYETVQEANPGRVVREADRSLVSNFIESARQLELKGVKAITTSCGFMAAFQNELRANLKVPVFTSSLLQVPMISMMLRQKQQVAIITANSRFLSDSHLKAVGITDEMNIVMAGMENESYFPRVYSNKPIESIDSNQEKIEAELIKVGKELRTRNPEVGAIVLECTNLPPFAKALKKAVGVPVFDIVTLINMVYQSVNQQEY
jgi:Asp/Glu/hydantoin racemase